MSVGQIEQFYGRVSKDPAMFNQLVAGTQTPDEFIDKAVAIGTQTGFSFTRDEADVWIKKQIEAKANGELSDLQLEGVAGGKGDSDQRIVDAVSTIGTEIKYQFNEMGSTISNWFSSW